MKFQQFTAPVRAKGLEDTAFYRAPVLLSLNEVGGEPGRFGHPPELFHAGNRVRLERWPLEMIGTSTHDTKRGEDARARVNVISELPDLWQRQVFTWMRVNAGCKTRVEGAPAPDRTDEYLYYQSLLGAFPAELLGDTPLPEVPAAFIERMQQFMLKAIKEAKRHTSWVSANPAYEEAVSRFVEATLSGRKARAFLEHFLPLARPVARAGMVNSLAQLTLKMASPGVADIYQGSELWNWDLADPDNRRPVNFAARRGMLRELEPCLSAALSPLVDGPDTSPGTSWRLDACVAQWLEHWTNGRIKQYVTACGLRVRRAFPDLIVRGTYQPLPAHGLRADHVVAFARAHNGHALAAVVPRLVARLPQSQLPIGQDVWADTSLQLAALDRAPAEAVTPGARATWRNLLTGRCLTPREGEQAIPLADVLDVCPVALLWRER